METRAKAPRLRPWQVGLGLAVGLAGIALSAALERQAARWASFALLAVFWLVATYATVRMRGTGGGTRSLRLLLAVLGLFLLVKLVLLLDPPG